jgi:hypothetical protein
MTPRTTYPSFPLPPRSRALAWVLGLTACAVVGAAVGWRLGR